MPHHKNMKRDIGVVPYGACCCSIAKWQRQTGRTKQGPSTREEAIAHCNMSRLALQGCVFTKNIDNAIQISDAMQTGTVQVNSAPARGPDHFPFQGFRDSGIGSQGITNSIELMTKTKTTVLNLAQPSYTLG